MVVTKVTVTQKPMACSCHQDISRSTQCADIGACTCISVSITLHSRTRYVIRRIFCNYLYRTAKLNAIGVIAYPERVADTLRVDGNVVSGVTRPTEGSEPPDVHALSTIGTNTRKSTMEYLNRIDRIIHLLICKVAILQRVPNSNAISSRDQVLANARM